jgi:hypothetical protein
MWQTEPFDPSRVSGAPPPWWNHHPGLPLPSSRPIWVPPDVCSSMVATSRPFEQEEITMAGKTPQKAAAKKAGKSLKEKRAVKKEKKDNRGGSSIL